MEPRTIRIVNNKTQSQTVIENTTLETLGELKAELDNRGVDYEGLGFYCGELHSELLDDAAPIPEKGIWRGVERPMITFLLTQPEKNIPSGAMTRAEAYQAVKDLDLQDEIKRRFGKNFTQCGTADLEEVINEVNNAAKVKAKAPVETPKDPISSELSCVIAAVNLLKEALWGENVLSYDDYKKVDELLNCASHCGTGASKKNDDMSQEEIDEMFGGWAK